MTTTDTKPPPLHGVARVLPWYALTEPQQREHFRVMHGWDVKGDPFWLHAADHMLAGSAHHVPHTHDKVGDAR